MKHKKLNMKRVAACVFTAAVLLTAVAVVSVSSMKKEAEDQHLLSYGVLQSQAYENSFHGVAASGTLADYEAAGEDDANILFINPATANIAVMNKDTGKVWYGAVSENDPAIEKAVNDDEIQTMLSQITVTAYDGKGNKSLFSGFQHSVSRGTFGIRNIPGGVRVDYFITNAPKLRLIPAALTTERFGILLGKMSSQNAELIKSQYMKLELNKLRDEEKSKILKEFPRAQDIDIYISRSETREFMLNKIENAFASVGYTFDDLNADEKAVARNTEAKEQAAFLIPVEFRLEGGDFIASILKEDIRYTSSMSLTSVAVLPYFGANSFDSGGYMLIPDGSGAIIDLNSRSAGTSPYTAVVYGVEDIAQPVWTKEKTAPVTLPVFGMKDGDTAFFAEITGGAALAEISADVSGPSNPFNHIGVQFAVRKTDSHPIYSTVEQTINLNLVQSGALKGTFSIQYSFLAGGDADYSGMANLYRRRLIDRGELKPLAARQDDPVHIVNTYGMIDARESKIGIPFTVKRPLTTAAEVKDMVRYFAGQTGTAPVINYIGSFNGGVRHSIPQKVGFESALGGQKGMQSLVDFMKSSNTEIFFEGGICMTERDTPADSFHPAKDSAYFLNRKYGKVFSPEAATFYHSVNPRYVVAPKRLPDIGTGFAAAISNLKATGISPRYMGSSLNSDFNEDSPVFRDQTLTYYDEVFKQIKSKNLKLLLTRGNSYIYRYADYITGLAMTDGGYPIETQSIPFVQMIIHGYISYTGPVYNDSSDLNHVLLKSIETGSGLLSSFIMSDYSEVKGTEYSYLRSSCFEDWKGKVAAGYQKLYDALKGLNNQPIIGHERLAKEIYKTRYANGKCVIVNYSGYDFTSPYGTVKSRDFLLSEVN